MSELKLSLTREDMIRIKYLSAGIEPDKYRSKLSESALELVDFIKKPIMMDAIEFESLEEVLPYLSYWDERTHSWEIPRDSEGRTWACYNSKTFCKDLLENNIDLFVELINFVFLPAKKRDGWVFSADTRGMMADLAVNNEVFVPAVISHYFKLLAKGASREQFHRLERWLKMPEVRENKKLIMMLAKSKWRSVQVKAIDIAHRSLYGFMIGEIDDPVAKYYLEKKMADENWHYSSVKRYNKYNSQEIPSYSLDQAYQTETGKRIERSR